MNVMRLIDSVCALRGALFSILFTAWLLLCNMNLSTSQTRPFMDFGMDALLAGSNLSSQCIGAEFKADVTGDGAPHLLILPEPCSMTIQLTYSSSWNNSDIQKHFLAAEASVVHYENIAYFQVCVRNLIKTKVLSR